MTQSIIIPKKHSLTDIKKSIIKAEEKNYLAIICSKCKIGEIEPDGEHTIFGCNKCGHVSASYHMS